MSTTKHIVIAGATSAIARHCALLWLARWPQLRLTLLGRDPDRLERTQQDLQARCPGAQIITQVVDFLDPVAINTVISNCAQAHPIDIALLAHGNLPDQVACQQQLTACAAALQINGVSVALFAEACAAQMAGQSSAQIALIGSVAGDRGRKSNYVYGAAKGLVERYAQGLQHRFAASGPQVSLIKPGPTDTPMTAHLKQQGARLASVNEVASTIVNGLDKRRAVIYAPAKWWLIMLVIRNLPAWLFNKLDI